MLTSVWRRSLYSTTYVTDSVRSVRFKPFSQIIIRDDITEAIFPKDEPAEGILRAALFSHIWVDLWRDLGATGGCTHKHTQKHAFSQSFHHIWSISPQTLAAALICTRHTELAEVCKYLVSNYLLFWWGIPLWCQHEGHGNSSPSSCFLLQLPWL